MATEIIEIASVFRERAARLRSQSRVADITRAQSLLLLAEEYDYKAQRFACRHSGLRGARTDDQPVEAEQTTRAVPTAAE